MSRKRFYTGPHIIANPDPSSGNPFTDLADRAAREARKRRRAERQAHNAAVRAARRAEQDRWAAYYDSCKPAPAPQAVCLSLLRHWRCQKPARHAASSSNGESDDAR